MGTYKIYISVFWTEQDGYTSKVHESKDQAIEQRGYGDFCGMKEAVIRRPSTKEDLK